MTGEQTKIREVLCMYTECRMDLTNLGETERKLRCFFVERKNLITL